MRCFGVCAITLLFVLSGCGEWVVEPVSPVARGGKHVKTCPNLRAFYKWQGKIYVRDGQSYHEVERMDDLCDITADRGTAEPDSLIGSTPRLFSRQGTERPPSLGVDR